MKWADVVRRVNLGDGETHEIDLNPAIGIEERQGSRGTYWAVIVEENGKVSELNMGRRLMERIAELNLTKPARLEIRRVGSGFETDYEIRRG